MEIEDIYQVLIETGLSEEDLQRKINEKAEEYQSFISKQAILFLIAKEMGLNIPSKEIDPNNFNTIEEDIDYDEFTVKIKEIKENTSNIVILGRIERIFGSKTFSRKDGTVGTVGSFLINDNSDKVKIVLWEEQVKIMESEFFRPNELIRLIGGYSKLGFKNKIEVHLNKRGKIVLSPKDVNRKDFPLLKKTSENLNGQMLKIQDLYNKEGVIRSISGTVFRIEFFKEIDLKDGEKSFLLKFILKDDTSTIKVNIWGYEAVKWFKIINQGDNLTLSNVLIKFNTYTTQKEINLIKKSKLINI